MYGYCIVHNRNFQGTTSVQKVVWGRSIPIEGSRVSQLPSCIARGEFGVLYSVERLN
jgi:hypothetical protein